MSSLPPAEAPRNRGSRPAPSGPLVDPRPLPAAAASALHAVARPPQGGRPVVPADDMLRASAAGALPALAPAASSAGVPPPGGRAAAAGEPGARILDEKCRNVPSPLKRWGRKHFRARQKIRDCLRFWQRSRRVLWWMTLTSSPESPPDRLRRDFQAWRKRLARLLRLEPADLQYVMVDTAEGHGVLHFVVAFPENCARFLDYRRLGENWQAIHGARQVRFVRVRDGDGSTRRLSHYMISQYMVTQGELTDLLGRVSSSRIVSPLWRLRRELVRRCTSPARVYQLTHDMMALGADFPDAIRNARRLVWQVFRSAWDSLVLRSWCDVFGDRLCVVAEGLEPL